jgi:glycosyltransferase involved in cell wall biosynthesis
LVNPGIWKHIATGGFDAVVAYIGYSYLTSWLVFLAAKVNSVPLLLTVDAITAEPRDHSRWKLLLKRAVLPRIFRLMDVVVASSSATVEFLQYMGVPSERIVLTRPTVDNEYWIRKAGQVDRRAVRASWGIEDAQSVVLFCAKLQPWKRPGDLLRAFARASVPGSYLIYAGEGPLRSELEREAEELGIPGRVRFLGFTNQSQLPAVYGASDLLVLPSEHEPFGLVVNEAMLCGCVPAVSDRVGAGYDLISPGKNGFRFACGDVEELAALMRTVLTDPERLAAVRQGARERMEAWSPQENIQLLFHAVERVAHLSPGQST